jgi:DeoR family suf operon transcriptional repressor
MSAPPNTSPSLSTQAPTIGDTAPSRDSARTREHAPTRDAALSLLLRHGEATATDLADRLGVSVQAMRRHLRSLEDDHLVEASPAVEGPGRPSNYWRLTDRGRARFPDGSEHFALGLMQSMAHSLSPDTMRLLMQQQAVEKAADYRQRIGAGSLGQRLERLVELRHGEGYVAELQREQASEGEAWVISEFHCSVMRIAEEFPMVCDQELQLICHTFPDCSVERVHWRLEEGHSCGFRLMPRPGAAADT